MKVLRSQPVAGAWRARHWAIVAVCAAGALGGGGLRSTSSNGAFVARGGQEVYSVAVAVPAACCGTEDCCCCQPLAAEPLLAATAEASCCDPHQALWPRPEGVSAEADAVCRCTTERRVPSEPHGDPAIPQRRAKQAADPPAQTLALDAAGCPTRDARQVPLASPPLPRTQAEQLATLCCWRA
jgi:hypothetical protein